jgi:hypothetical protein
MPGYGANAVIAARSYTVARADPRAPPRHKNKSQKFDASQFH